MTLPALPPDGNTAWGNGGWAEGIDTRVRANGSAATPTVRTLGTGPNEALPGDTPTTTPDATETVKGKAEVATQAETTTGTADNLIVTPLKLAVELAKKAPLRATRTTQTGATYTFVLADANTLVEGNSASAQTFTVPNSVFTAEDTIVVRQYGAGQITVAAGAGTTARAAGGALKTAAQYAELVITFRTASEFVVSGYSTT